MHMDSASRLIIVSMVLAATMITTAAPVLGQSSGSQTAVDHDADITVVTEAMPDTLYADEGTTASVLIQNDDTRTMTVVAVLYVDNEPIAVRGSTMDSNTSETVTFPAGPEAFIENQSIAPGTANVTAGGNYTWSVRIGGVEWGSQGPDIQVQGISNGTYQGDVVLNDARVTREFQLVGEDRVTAIAAESGDTDSGGGDSSDEGPRDDTADSSNNADQSRGFFSNDTQGGISSFTLTVGGFLLSVIGILYQMVTGN